MAIKKAMRALLSQVYHRTLPCIGRICSKLNIVRPTILCLHSVEKHDSIDGTSGAMAVTDIFLDALLHHARHRNIAIIGLDECLARLRASDFSPYLCLTFDDGYRDNFEVAYPILRKYQAPAAIFLATALLDHTSPMWWHPLERAISMSRDFGLKTERDALKTEADRRRAYGKWAFRFRAADPAERLDLLNKLAAFNPHFRVSDAFDSVLEWDMVREMAASGLVEFGAHTATHPVMAHLTEAELIAEVGRSRDRCTEMIGSKPKYFAYPFGQPQEIGLLAPEVVERAGFAAAFTTTASTLRASNSKSCFRLPRIMLTRRTQRISTVNAYTSGLTELIRSV